MRDSKIPMCALCLISGGKSATLKSILNAFGGDNCQLKGNIIAPIFAPFSFVFAVGFAFSFAFAVAFAFAFAFAFAVAFAFSFA